MSRLGNVQPSEILENPNMLLKVMREDYIANQFRLETVEERLDSLQVEMQRRFDTISGQVDKVGKQVFRDPIKETGYIPP